MAVFVCTTSQKARYLQCIYIILIYLQENDKNREEKMENHKLLRTERQVLDYGFHAQSRLVD